MDAIYSWRHRGRLQAGLLEHMLQEFPDSSSANLSSIPVRLPVRRLPELIRELRTRNHCEWSAIADALENAIGMYRREAENQGISVNDPLAQTALPATEVPSR